MYNLLEIESKIWGAIRKLKKIIKINMELLMGVGIYLKANKMIENKIRKGKPQRIQVDVPKELIPVLPTPTGYGLGSFKHGIIVLNNKIIIYNKAHTIKYIIAAFFNLMIIMQLPKCI